jgi:hypothetical protein
MISNRTKFSLSQFLSLQDLGYLRTLLYKHGIPSCDALSNAPFYTAYVMDELCNVILWATSEQLLSLLGEIVRTGADLRARVTPEEQYHDRWADLVRCLELDGYRIEGKSLIPIEPKEGERIIGPAARRYASKRTD